MRKGRLRTWAVLGLLVLSITIATTAPAHAYVDPQTGSFVTQILIGAAVGAGAAIIAFWRRLAGFFGRLFGRRPKGQSAAEPPSQ